MTGAAAGRKSRPSHLKIAEGRGNGTDSGGRPVPDLPPFRRAIPVKPDDLTAAASRFWDRIVEDMTHADSLKPLDGFAMEALCESYSRWHEAKTERAAGPLTSITSQGVGVSPLVRVEAEASREFRSWCAEFGLTPAAEMKLATSKDPSDDGGVF
jgi:P27 family predicted phage terminase small subunit